MNRGTRLNIETINKLTHNLKHILFVLIFILGNLCVAQDSTSVQVIARPLPNKIMLRWAVNEPLAWKQANEHGFLIERATIGRNDMAVVPIERQMLVASPLKPQPLEAWETPANQDQNVAVMAQALFGDSFEVTTPGSEMGELYAISEELEQRFTIALLAAEQNFEAAKLAGWGFEDNSIVNGEKYVYTISVALPQESGLKIKDAAVYASTDLYEKLPVPIGLAATFGDGYAQLSWNFSLLQSIYTNYIVERSEDNSNFSQLNGLPIFNAEKNDGSESLSLHYTDSIPNGKTYYYRIKGKTAFNETSEASEVVFGGAKKELEFVPRISRKEIPTDTEAILFWEFNEKGNEQILGFELQRGNTDQGPFEVIKQNIPSVERSTHVQNLKRINYFKIIAKGKNGLDSESFTTMVQPVDSIPPKAPIGLTGKMDTTGIVTLNWNKNLEEDLSGYRIFRANNPNVEFSEVTIETFKSATFLDTVPSINLNQKIYYKIQAEDQRYNRSEDSEMLTIIKPDMIPPSPPVLTKYRVTEEGIRINWIPSSSDGIASHSIYRKMGVSSETEWTLIESTIQTDTTYLDSKVVVPNNYSYTIVAKDSVGLESTPSNALTVLWKGKTLDKDDIKFSGTVNRELRFINLSWRVKNQDVVEYRLYRGNTVEDLKLYKTFEGNINGFNDVSLEINSTYTYGLQLILRGGTTSLIKKISLKY